MPELRLTRTATHLHVQLDGREAPVGWAAFAALAGDQALLVHDSIAYGGALYQLVFVETGLSVAIEALPTSARLLVVSDDPLINAAGWEYLRTADNSLLAARLSLVRAGSPVQRPPSAGFTLPAPPTRLKIMAVVAAPVDETRPLNTEGEWKRLQTVTKQAGKALTLTRVRPPTPAKLSRTLDPSACNVIHFMGHSNSEEGRSVLLFENELGRRQSVTAEDFADQLDASVVLVVLNSCRSAVAEAEWTEFGNLARGLVGRGVPYALGMNALLPDAAALEITDAFYAYLLQGRSIEESVRRVRAGLANNALLPDAAWLAGLPVLYSSRPASEPSLSLLSLLAAGEPTINPDPIHLESACDLTAIPAAAHFVGRVDALGAALDALTGPQRTPLVVIHGLGGMGKTTLARAVAERASWFFGDRALALSFETFAHMAGAIRQIDPSFAGRFFARLARFYGLDPADGQRYPTPESLQEGILQQRKVRSSLLVLDNLETLLDVLEQDDTTAKAQARPLAAFLARLHEGDGAILITTRIMPPPDWGRRWPIHLNGLEDTAGAALFWELLPASRRTSAPLLSRIALSQRVQGHPVSLRLLAGRFGQGVEKLVVFLTGIEQTLRTAEQNTPASLADPERQVTLYACMAYSVERLTSAQREVLRRVSLFRSPFPVEFGVQTAADSKDDDELPEKLTPEDAERLLQDLVRLGLLESEDRTVIDGSLILYDLHAMLRWYVAEALPAPEAEALARYALTMAKLAHKAYEDFDRYAWLRMLVSNMAADLDAALPHLPPPKRSRTAYHLALPYKRLGFMRRTLELYEEALEIDSAENNLRSIAVTQRSMGDMLLQMGQPQAALALYQQALDTTKALGDVKQIAVTQHSMADVLFQMGQPQAALALNQEALDTKKALGDVRQIAVTQSSMAAMLGQMGQPQAAFALYQETLVTLKVLGDVRGVAVTQSNMANVLRHMGQPQEVLALYQEALDTLKVLGDVHSITLTQSSMADVLHQMGQPQAALALYQEALDTKKALGDLRSIAVTQRSMAGVLSQMGQLQAALALNQEALDTSKALGDLRSIAVTQSSMANVLSQMGQPQAALAIFQEALDTQKALGDVRGIAVTQSNFGQFLLQEGEAQRALEMLWAAYTTLSDADYAADAAAVRDVLVDVKTQKLGADRFDSLWPALGAGAQPAWLAETQSAPSVSFHLPPDQQRTLVANTVAVLTTALEKRAEWRTIIEAAGQRMAGDELADLAALNAAILTLLDGEPAAVPTSNEYHSLWQAILNGVAQGALPESPETTEDDDPDAELRLVAIQDFIDADGLVGKRTVVEVQAALLLTTKTKAIFAQNIAEARAEGDTNWADRLQLHLDLLADCRHAGIAAAFTAWEARAATASEEDDEDNENDDDEEPNQLPFDPALITQTIAVLRGSPQDRLAHLQTILPLATQAGDPTLKSFWDAVQMVLVGGDLREAGHGLSGVYAQLWAAIVAGVTGNEPQNLLDILVRNTLAVLGPAAAQRAKWQTNLEKLQSQAVTEGERGLADLVETVLALLAAGGNPSGLGAGLEGPFAQAWQEIVAKLGR